MPGIRPRKNFAKICLTRFLKARKRAAFPTDGKDDRQETRNRKTEKPERKTKMATTINDRIRAELSEIDSIVNRLHWTWTPTNAVIRGMGHFSRRQHEARLAVDADAQRDATFAAATISRILHRCAVNAFRARAHKAEIAEALTAALASAGAMLADVHRIAPTASVSLKKGRATVREALAALAK